MCTPTYPQTQAEIDAGVVPTNLEYPANPAPPERYGAIGDGVADDTIAMQSWASVAAPRSLLDRRYRCNDGLTFTKHASLLGSGSGRSIIDFTGATGAFAGARAVDFSQGSLVALPALNADVSEGDTQIVFASAHGLSQGDVFVLHDPAAGSWSGHLATYTKGEMCVVAEVVSATTVGLLEPLYDGYTAANTNVWRLDYGTVQIERVGIIGVGTDSAVIPLFLSHTAHSRLRDVKVTGSGLTTVTLRYGYDIEADGLVAYQYFEGTEVGTQQYGVSILHCQDVRLKGHFQGERHAVVTGSTSGHGGIVNRGVLVSGYLKSLIRHAADFHGNTEHSAFDGCVINGAVALGGNNNSVRNSTVNGSAAIDAGKIIGFREMRGFNFEIANISGRTLGNPHATGGQGVVDIGGNVTTALNAQTALGGTLRIHNVTIDAPNANAGARFVNRGCTQSLNIRIDGLHLNISSGTDTAFGLVRIDNISGGNFRSISLHHLTGTPGLQRSKINFDVDEIVWEHARGTFTPAFAFAGQSTGIAYTSRIGWYEIVGNVVHWHAHLQLTSKGSASGNATITGLPFKALNVPSLDIPADVQGWNMTFADVLSAIHVANTTTVALQEVTTLGALSAITDADFTNTTRLRLSGSYLRDN